MLQLTINLLAVNHEPFFPLSYYVVRDLSESSRVGHVVTTGNVLSLSSMVSKINIFVGQ